MKRVLVALILALFGAPAVAADYPAPKTGEWVAKDFKFHTGEVMPELRLAYDRCRCSCPEGFVQLEPEGDVKRQTDRGPEPESKEQ